MAKSVCVAYLLWLCFGWLGAHLFYLRRDIHALIYCFMPGGYFGVGWLRDLYRIPAYVRDANNDPELLKKLSEDIKKSERPPLRVVRTLIQLMMGNLFSLLLVVATPGPDDLGGVNLIPIMFWLAPAATALGVWFVGNEGREKGSIVPPLLGCYAAAFVSYLLGVGGNNSFVAIAGVATFHWKAKQWRRAVSPPKSLCKRAIVVILCCTLFWSLVSSYVYFNLTLTTRDGDEVKARDAVHNFITSPMFTEFRRQMGELWSHAWQKGFFFTFQQLIESLDPLGEKNALKVLELKAGVTQEEIKSRYRELSKRWHPDKFTSQLEKEEAHTKFLEIQQAYERLSDIKSRRTRRNKLHKQ